MLLKGKCAKGRYERGNCKNGRCGEVNVMQSRERDQRLCLRYSGMQFLALDV